MKITPAPRSLLPTLSLIAGAAAWLTVVRATDAAPSPGTGGWLVAIVVALAGTTLLVPLARRAAEPWQHRALEGALVALAAATATALALTLAEALAPAASRALPLEFARDLALSLFVTAPLAWLAAEQTSSAPTTFPESDSTEIVLAPTKGSTRRSFMKVGAGAVGTAALMRVAPAASAAPRRFVLTVTEGDIHMIDQVPVFFRTFAGPDGKPQIPGPPLGNPGPFETNPEIIEGQTVQVVITNLTARDHTFLIERTENEAVTDPVVGPVTIPAGGIPVEIQFTAPSAGTYIYRDADRNNRILGMHGVMIVMPKDGSNRPYTPAPDRFEIPAEFLAQYVWVFHDTDPLLGELARSNPHVQNLDYPLEKIVPRYFTINGVSGVQSTENLVTVPVFPVQDPLASQVGVFIRVVNTGVASHSPHWHGNHFFVVERNAVPLKPGFVQEKDVMRLTPLQRTGVLLPIHSGLDAWPPLDPTKGFGEQAYPMHCHAEMSQTAAGGLYPMGALTDWRLVAQPQDTAAVRALVASGKQTQAAKAEIARVLGRR